MIPGTRRSDAQPDISAQNFVYAEYGEALTRSVYHKCKYQVGTEPTSREPTISSGICSRLCGRPSERQERKQQGPQTMYRKRASRYVIRKWASGRGRNRNITYVMYASPRDFFLSTARVEFAVPACHVARSPSRGGIGTSCGLFRPSPSSGLHHNLGQTRLLYLDRGDSLADIKTKG